MVKKNNDDNLLDYPSSLKIAVIGQRGVGKSTFIRSWFEGWDAAPKDMNDEEKSSNESKTTKATMEVKSNDNKIDLKEEPLIKESTQKKKSVRIAEVMAEVEMIEIHTEWIPPKDGKLSEIVVNSKALREYEAFIFIVDENDNDSVFLVNKYAHSMTELIQSDKTKTMAATLFVSTHGKRSKKSGKMLDSLVKRFDGNLLKRQGIESSCVNIGDAMVGVGVGDALEQCVKSWRKSWSKSEEQRKKEVFKQEVTKSTFLDCCMSGGATVMYDMLTIVVSLADVTTDLWVLIQWYHLKRTVPFYISLTILVLAQMSYIMAFLLRFADNSNFTCYLRPKYNYQTSYWSIIPFLICISPLLSFVMYFGSLPNTWFFNFMNELGFDMDEFEPGRNATKIERFLQEKLVKHMGFLLEAAVEAFPQSILQMAVMVYYSETNWISVASILLSLISVCTKSLVFSYALELRTMIFNYLSIVLDFISVFALITWVFYNPNGNGLTQLAQIWVYKICATTVPAVYLVGFGYATTLVFEDWESRFRYADHPWRETFILFIGCYTGWLVGSPFAVLMVEMCCCAGIAMMLFIGFAARFSSSGAQGIFWGYTFSFINAGRTWRDKKLRTILVIETMLENGGTRDSKLLNKISENRQDLYENLTWKDLRTNIYSPWKSTPLSIMLETQDRMWQDISDETDIGDWTEIKRKWNDKRNYGPWSVIIPPLLPVMAIFVIYFCMPVYVLSRIFNFTFVWIALSMTKFEDIDNLQLGMAGLLGFLQILWLCALISVLRLHFVTWHILTGRTSVSVGRLDNEDKALARLKKITDLHQAYTSEPDRRQAVIDALGPDIGSVLLQYLPTLVHDLGVKT